MSEAARQQAPDTTSIDTSESAMSILSLGMGGAGSPDTEEESYYTNDEEVEEERQTKTPDTTALIFDDSYSSDHNMEDPADENSCISDQNPYEDGQSKTPDTTAQMYYDSSVHKMEAQAGPSFWHGALPPQIMNNSNNDQKLEDEGQGKAPDTTALMYEDSSCSEDTMEDAVGSHSWNTGVKLQDENSCSNDQNTEERQTKIPDTTTVMYDDQSVQGWAESTSWIGSLKLQDENSSSGVQEMPAGQRARAPDTTVSISDDSNTNDHNMVDQSGYGLAIKNLTLEGEISCSTGQQFQKGWPLFHNMENLYHTVPWNQGLKLQSEAHCSSSQQPMEDQKRKSDDIESTSDDSLTDANNMNNPSASGPWNKRFQGECSSSLPQQKRRNKAPDTTVSISDESNTGAQSVEGPSEMGPFNKTTKRRLPRVARYKMLNITFPRDGALMIATNKEAQTYQECVQICKEHAIQKDDMIELASFRDMKRYLRRLVEDMNWAVHREQQEQLSCMLQIKRTDEMLRVHRARIPNILRMSGFHAEPAPPPPPPMGRPPFIPFQTGVSQPTQMNPCHS